ncbi:RNB domain-containing ribonuclease [Propionibacteriaceae bacterium Y1923]
MPAVEFRITPELPDPLRAAFEDLREELSVPTEFPDEVLAEVDQVVARGFDQSLGHVDLTDIAFVTIDPPDSMDLDQAMHIARTDDGGYLVHYAIADVAAWLPAGGAIDAETHRRGQTFYAPHTRYPLHPPTLSEGAASLLADGVARPAQVWRMQLDQPGEIVDATVIRGLVASRAKLNYADVQADIDAGTAIETMVLLKEVGQLRQRVEVERGGVSLNLPDQQVEVDDDGAWRLSYREPLPNEDWNAQISLMTGFSAARIMLDAGVGVLRTLPPASKQTINLLRKVAASLKLPWPDSMDYGDFVRSLDPGQPQGQAMMMACVRLFRGAGYTIIEPGLSADETVHGALAAQYAHVTAPLRRLVDRYVGEICVALCAGDEVPEWVLSALDELPDTMRESDRRAKAFERGITNMVEALILQDRVGEKFEGVVVSVDEGDRDEGVISLTDPAVEAPVKGRGVALGEVVTVTLKRASVADGKVSFVTR